MQKFQIEHFLIPESGQDVFLGWLESLRDTQAKVAVIRRIARLEVGNFGDHKFCRDGVFELRFDVGPGYRVYCAISGSQIVLLLCGGSKRTQDTDIEKACGFWRLWKEAR